MAKSQNEPVWSAALEKFRATQKEAEENRQLVINAALEMRAEADRILSEVGYEQAPAAPAATRATKTRKSGAERAPTTCSICKAQGLPGTAHTARTHSRWAEANQKAS